MDRLPGPADNKRASLKGGPTETIGDLPSGSATVHGISWNSDGTILVGAAPAGLVRMRSVGGDVETLAKPTKGGVIMYPQALPGGRAVLYTETAGTADSSELRQHERRRPGHLPLGCFAAVIETTDVRRVAQHNRGLAGQRTIGVLSDRRWMGAGVRAKSGRGSGRAVVDHKWAPLVVHPRHPAMGHPGSSGSTLLMAAGTSGTLLLQDSRDTPDGRADEGAENRSLALSPDGRWLANQSNKAGRS